MKISMISWLSAWRKYGLLGLLLVSLSLVSGCGGGVVPGAIDASSLRALPTAFLERQAIAYSPYRSSNRDTETVSKANIQQDLQLLIAAGYI
jgi:hypothetical protein